jgi:hypothetical protein
MTAALALGAVRSMGYGLESYFSTLPPRRYEGAFRDSA